MVWVVNAVLHVCASDACERGSFMHAVMFPTSTMAFVRLDTFHTHSKPFSGHTPSLNLSACCLDQCRTVGTR